jgi:hypothetical protein
MLASEAGRSARYNSPVPYMQRGYLRLLRQSRACCVVLSLCLLANAADWNEPARRLAQKIAGRIGKNAIALEVQNRSSLSQADVDAIRTSLEREFIAAGLRFSPGNHSASPVRITLSENLESYLWIAELPANPTPGVSMITVPRTQPASVVHEPVTLVIRKIQLWTQPEQMLDVAVIDSSPPRLIILDRNRITLYRLEGTAWHEDLHFDVKHTHPWPRDLRGRLIMRNDHLFDAHLPGVTCSSGPGSQLSLSCRESDDPWPLGGEQATLTAFFSPARNFFTGVITGLGSLATVSPFYTVASTTTNGHSRWIFSAIDGQFRITTDNGLETLDAPDWGSDIATLESDCRTGNQILASASGEPASDSVRAFELNEHRAVPVSQPVTFDGRVTALWTETNGRNAVGIVHNEDTGTYEAFRLAVTCGR